MRSNPFALLAMLLCTSAASPALGASLTPLGDLPGSRFFGFYSQAYGVSADGSVVVGFSDSASGAEAFRWTAAAGMVGLGDLPGGHFGSMAYGVSADGSIVVGKGSSTSSFSSSAVLYEAFRWTAGSGMVALGDLPGGNFDGVANGVSADGSIVVGTSSSHFSGNLNEAFRWTAGSGMVGLGDLPEGYPWSFATGVSANGSVIVGQGSPIGDWSLSVEAFRWTASSGMVGLGYLESEFQSSSALGVSGDGSVVVGYGNSASDVEAFRWTEESGMLGLGQLPGGDHGWATAVNADGSVIVGFGYVSGSSEAFRWSAASGMERLWDVLLAGGLDPAADGWTRLFEARGVSADGNTIVGTGVRNGNSEAFIAVIPEPSSFLLFALAVPALLLCRRSRFGRFRNLMEQHRRPKAAF